MASPTRTAGLATLALLASAAVLASSATGASGTVAGTNGTEAPVATGGDYLVVLKASASSSDLTRTAATAERAGGDVRTRYSTALRGFAATLTARQLATVKADADIAYVQPNRRYHATDIQRGVGWGLDRVDQRSRTRNGSYWWRAHRPTGRVYVLDSGIQAQAELPGARTVTTTIGGTRSDCAGHGTHVAGIIGSNTYGVAKKSAPIGVKVLNCDGQGTSESVVRGVDYVLDHLSSAPTVVNLSLGGDQPGHDEALEAAVQRLIDAGVTVVAAAGNSGDDACDYSPGSVPGAITVAASDSLDRRASFSNYGSCVDLYAPGSYIWSTWIKDAQGRNRVARQSGTSVATPFVTGAALLYRQWYPSATPAQVTAALAANATHGVITRSGSARNGDLLLAKPQIPPPPATTARTRIYQRTALVREQKICSPNGKYCLARRAGDHHLRLYRVADGRLIWSNNVSSAWTYLRSDGDLVSYDSYGRIVWQAGAHATGKAELRVRDRGYLVLVAAGTTYWNTRPFEP